MSNMFSRYLFGALVLSFMCSGLAQAACERNDRINMDDAECLSGSWSNQTWPNSDNALVRSHCSELGTVVAKIDRKDAADWTVWLSGDDTVVRSGTAGNIRGIHCCSDLSDLCNKSDIVNPGNCVEQFRASPAFVATNEGEVAIFMHRRCSGATATADPDNLSCTIDASCTYWELTERNTFREVSGPIQVTVPYTDVSRLALSRDGVLSVQ